MHIRQEQQKQQYLMGGAPFYMPTPGTLSVENVGWRKRKVFESADERFLGTGGPQGFPPTSVGVPYQSGNMMAQGMFQPGPGPNPSGPGQPFMGFPQRFPPQMPQGKLFWKCKWIIYSLTVTAEKKENHCF